MNVFQAEIKTEDKKQTVDLYWHKESGACCTHKEVHTLMGDALVVKSIRVWDPAERIPEFLLSFQKPQNLDLIMNLVSGILSQFSE